MIKRNFATFVETKLRWALKFKVGSNSTPKNFMVGLGDWLANSIEEIRSSLGVLKNC
jgi:hypothetical protein